MARYKKDGVVYDSKWEYELTVGLLEGAEFHPKDIKVSYEIPHKYSVDFLIKDSIRGDLWIESKGRFRDSAEARKYPYIRDQLEKEGKRFIILFQKPGTPMPFAKRRKDGTKQTHGEWATKQGIQWSTVGDFNPEDVV